MEAKIVDQIGQGIGRSATPRMIDCDVAIIGAGPYGLSAAAHLKARGLSVFVFGEPMEFWAKRMPEGMLLRSPRVASNLSDPEGKLTLEAFEIENGRRPEAPLPLSTFVEYGRWFRQQLGSIVDARIVTLVEDDGGDFKLTLADGEVLRARTVVAAAGIGPFLRKPQVFRDLSIQASHCYEGRKIHEFKGKRVSVVGAGQSALESAALLHEIGAEVEVISRNEQLRWVGIHSWLHHLGPISAMLYSPHDVGPAGISRVVAAPKLVASFPLPVRDKVRTRAVRPAGSKWLIPRLKDVRITTGRTVTAAVSEGDEVLLTLDDGTQRRADHVLLGTGYDVDVSRYRFLSEGILRRLLRIGGSPSLGKGFSSSVPGLYFIGGAAARSFGPLMYFVAGTEFTSRELGSYFDRTSKRK